MNEYMTIATGLSQGMFPEAHLGSRAPVEPATAEGRPHHEFTNWNLT